MNFSPPLRPTQLSFSFIEAPDPELTPWGRLGISRSCYFVRRRLQRTANAAYELGKRRRPVMRPPARTPRPFLPGRDEAHELCQLARRIERLCPSHRSPEKFHEDKSQIVYELRAIAARRRIA